MTHAILIAVYVVSAVLEIVGLATIFQPAIEDRHDGTSVWVPRRSGVAPTPMWVPRRSGAWLIGIGIAVGLVGNITALYLSH